MKKTILFLSAIAVIMMFGSITEASSFDPNNFIPTDFKAANDYNVFVRGNYGNYENGIYDTHDSDVEGRLAAGGDINIKKYSVGKKAPESTYNMVSGGNINFISGSVSNGGIFAEGNIYLDHAGPLDPNHNVTSLIIDPLAKNPVDFDDAFAYLDDLSAHLSSMNATGITTVESWGKIILEGNDDVNIFNVNGADLDSSCGLKFIIGDNDKAIVNILGATTFRNFGISGVDGKERDVVYNFLNSEFLDINKIGVIGNILAPKTNITFNSGVINGNIVANSFKGTGQSNWPPYEPIPEPGTIILLGTGLVGIFSMRKKFSAKKPSDN